MKMFSVVTKSIIRGRIFSFRSMANWRNSDIVWVDMEMTGLDVNRCRVMEIAVVLTDAELNIISKGPDLIIHQSNEVLNGMDKWCKDNLKELEASCRISDITEEKAEEIIMNFLKENNIVENQSPLAGNSVYTDRLFLSKYLSKVDNYLHYRIVDVSTVKELAARWNKKVYSSAPKKKLNHRAMDDILESIQELKFYKENLFIHDSNESV